MEQADTGRQAAERFAAELVGELAAMHRKTALVGLVAWFAWSWRRRGAMPPQRAFLWALVAAGPAATIAREPHILKPGDAKVGDFD